MQFEHQQDSASCETDWTLGNGVVAVTVRTMKRKVVRFKIKNLIFHSDSFKV